MADDTLPSLRRDGDVLILDLGGGEGRCNPDRNSALLDLLAEAESEPVPRALVTTSTGKVWSNGLDLDWMGAHPDRAQEVIDGTHRVLSAFLSAGVATVAAVQGHAFAAGAMLALAHDQRVMREDRGWWCLPEVDLGMVFTPGMNALVAARLPHRSAHQAMVTGRRYTGPEAVAAGIVDEVAPEVDVLATAVARAAARAGADGRTLRGIKRRLHAPVLAALEGSQPLEGPGAPG